jgi:hypothetical protein
MHIVTQWLTHIMINPRKYHFCLSQSNLSIPQLNSILEYQYKLAKSQLHSLFL